MYCTVQYCAVLFSTVLCYHTVVLYSTVLNCTVLYCTALYCTNTNIRAVNVDPIVHVEATLSLSHHRYFLVISLHYHVKDILTLFVYFDFFFVFIPPHQFIIILSININACLPIHLSVCLSACLPICQSSCMSSFFSAYLFNSRVVSYDIVSYHKISC